MGQTACVIQVPGCLAQPSSSENCKLTLMLPAPNGKDPDKELGSLSSSEGTELEGPADEEFL